MDNFHMWSVIIWGLSVTSTFVITHININKTVSVHKFFCVLNKPDTYFFISNIAFNTVLFMFIWVITNVDVVHESISVICDGWMAIYRTLTSTQAVLSFLCYFLSYFFRDAEVRVNPKSINNYFSYFQWRPLYKYVWLLKPSSSKLLRLM
jgi:hypothetical protein